MTQQSLKPETFNEKMQWLKLYYRDPLMTQCADKYLVRNYIKDTIGVEFLIPLIAVFDKAEQAACVIPGRRQSARNTKMIRSQEGEEAGVVCRVIF